MIDLAKVEFSKAMKEYQKLSFKSSYGTFFGRKPGFSDIQDIEILKVKKFSQLQITEMLNKAALTALDSWQELKDESDYYGMALISLRSLFTHYKNKLPKTSTTRDHYKILLNHEKFDTIRFDKIITKAELKAIEKSRLSQNNFFK